MLIALLLIAAFSPLGSAALSEPPEEPMTAPAPLNAPENGVRSPNPSRVRYGPPAKARFETELITDTGGYRKTGGQGRSCWGYNHANIVRHRNQLYALCWRDDLSLVVYRRAAPGRWEASPPLPEALQSGVLLVDSKGRLHVIGGDMASYHALFDPPGQVRKFTLHRRAQADTRFGAAIAPGDDIFVVGGYPQMRWYVLSARRDFQPVASGSIPHPTWRAYYFAHYDGRRAQTYCYNIQHVEGVGYQTLWTYYYDNPNLLERPDDWRMTVISDVSDTFDGKAARGTTSNEDMLVDRKGRVHFLYMINRQPGTGTWPSEKQDRGQDALYHAVGPPGGPFRSYLLGNFSRGRLYQTRDGRLHYLLERGEWFHFDLWYAVGGEDDFDTISDHIFVNAARAGGTPTDFIDIYFTGPYPGQTNRIWYGKLTPGEP
jgi:hypothetical protein